VQADVEQEIAHLASLCKADVVRLDVPNTELGVICKKPFSIMVLGVA
jgi:ribosomal protein L30E